MVESHALLQDHSALQAHWPCYHDQDHTDGASISSCATSECFAKSSAGSTAAAEIITNPGVRRDSVTTTRAKEKDDVPLLTRILYGCASWFTSNVPKAPAEGNSLGDWAQLTRTQPNLNTLNGRPPRDDITMEEVRIHNTREDAWMVFNGSVYNITPYLKFHPGGTDILLKVAGKDGTSQFMKHHPWVNIRGMMAACLVGTLAMDPLQARAAAEIRQARLLREQQRRRQQQQQQRAVEAGSKVVEEVVQQQQGQQAGSEAAVEAVQQEQQEQQAGSRAAVEAVQQQQQQTEGLPLQAAALQGTRRCPGPANNMKRRVM